MTDLQKAAEYKALGNDAFKNKRFEEAIEHFSKAIECNPNDHTYFSNRSACYVNTGKYEQALKDGENCIKIKPDWPRGYQRKGNALEYLHKLDDAIQTYQEGLKYDPNNNDLKSNLSDAEVKIHQPQGGAFPGPQGDNPMMNQAYLQGLMKLVANPETKDMINDPAFMKKIQQCMQNPSLIPMMTQQDPQIAKAWQVISQDMPQNFDIEQLLKGMNMGGGEEPAKPQPKKEEPKKEAPKKQEKMEVEKKPDEAAKDKGNEFFKKKDFKSAIDHYNEAISINPEEPLYYNNKAACFIESGDFESALLEVEKAEKLFADGIVKDWVKKAKVFARKASILFKQGKLNESIEWYEKSLLEDGNQKVKDELSKVRKTKKEQEQLAYINPDEAAKANERAKELYNEGKFPQALKEYEEAIKRSPKEAKYHSNLGTCFVKLMEFAGARDCFEKALSLDENYIKAYPKLGDCHFFLKQYHKALEAFERGLKKDPENQLCKQGIQKTQQQIYLSNSQEDQETRAKRAMQDPEIQQILQTPEVRNALADLEKDPNAAQRIFANPDLRSKMQKLIEAGIIRTG